jgi:hypothetical protein
VSGLQRPGGRQAGFQAATVFCNTAYQRLKRRDYCDEPALFKAKSWYAQTALILFKYLKSRHDLNKVNVAGQFFLPCPRRDAFVKNPNCHPERSEGSLRKTKCIIIADA